MELENRSPEVDLFLGSLTHSRRDEVERLRLAILAAEPAISETVKWNAPSFRYAGEDRVTFRLHPRDQVQLVFHRGSRVRPDQEAVELQDPDGLLTWLSPDRAVLTLASPDETQTRLSAVVDLVGHWVRA